VLAEAVPIIQARAKQDPDNYSNYDLLQDRLSNALNIESAVISSEAMRLYMATRNKYDAYQKELSILYFVTLMIFMVVTLFSGFVLLRKVVHPLSGIQKDTEILGDGNMDHRAVVSKGDNEVSALAGAFNAMADSLQEKTVSVDTLIAAHKEIERKNAQILLSNEALEQMVDELTSSNEELARFAYVCSHDLQEPLRMVRCFSELLQSRIGDQLQDDEKSSRYFQYITDGAERSQSLITDILAYSRIDSDTKKSSRVDLNRIVKEIRRGFYTGVSEQGFRLTSDDLPVIYANETQIYQLFQNLIGNGFKYSAPDRAPHVHISVAHEGDRCRFSVTDNGIGIKARHAEKIFQVFQRLHGKDEYSGTGVGLSICKKIVEKHFGKIWVESVPDEGSTFYFTLPVDLLEAQQEETAEPLAASNA